MSEQPRHLGWRRQKSEQVTARAIDRLAAFSAGLRQGGPSDDIPIYVDVSCGRPVLRIANQTYVLATRQVMVQVRLEENATYQTGSAVEHVVQEGEFLVGEDLATSRTTEGSVKGGAELDVKLSLVDPKAGLDVAVGGKASTNTEAKKDTQAKRHPKIVLMAALGVGSKGGPIVIGHDRYGDPRMEDGLLIHNYPPGQDSAPPLLKVVPIDPTKPMRVTIFTTVPANKLRMFEDDTPQAASSAVKETAEASSNVAVAEYNKLRRRMMADLVAQSARRQQRAGGFTADEGELVIAMETFEIHPEFEDPPR